jgi:hypothetical protein
MDRTFQGAVRHPDQLTLHSQLSGEIVQMDDVRTIQQSTCIEDNEINADDLPQSSSPTLPEQHVERLNSAHRQQDQTGIDSQPPLVYETWNHQLQVSGTARGCFVWPLSQTIPSPTDYYPENDP